MKLLRLLALLALALPAIAGYSPPLEYGVATTITFDLYNTDGTLDVDEVDGGAEVTLYCDEAAGATATNDFVDEGTFYSLALTASEMQCARLVVSVGATDTNNIHIWTIGSASAQVDDDGGWYDAIPTVSADVVSISGDTPAANNAESFFDGTGYAGTNNVIPTVTDLTNLPSIPSNWLTAGGIAAGALDGKGNWNIGKTGYSLTNEPANFSLLSIDGSGLVDITQAAADKPWGSTTRSLTTLSGISNLGWNSTWDTEVQSEVTDAINALFNFTVAGQVDANAQYWDDAEIATALQTATEFWDTNCTSPTVGTVREQLCADLDDVLADTNALETRLTLARADYLDVLAVQDTALANCEVNTVNFAGSTTTLACILTDRDGGAITQATGDLEGLELVVTSGAQIREQRFINDTTWDAGNSELQLTLSRALPATLADAVTAVIR